MAIELSREAFRTMILYHWKIGLNYRGSHARLMAAWGGGEYLPIEQSLTGFMNTNVKNWTSLIHLVLDDLALQ